LDHPVPADPERRRAVERTIAVLRQVWSGSVFPAEGFLRPVPAPPIVVAAFGPRMAELAGRVGDGVCVPAGPKLAELIAVARRARAQSGRDPEQFLVTASLPSVPKRAEPWVELGVDRLIVYVASPFEEGVERLAKIR
jgi:alkanesulfonate monooxygenase SsuD/methylene tetrahydromethanopterin reductase-like flavin-dependent oxidoreductase (luciferase family)